MLISVNTEIANLNKHLTKKMYLPEILVQTRPYMIKVKPPLTEIQLHMS